MSVGAGFRHDLRTVLRQRGFRRLFAVRITSQAADGAMEAALAGLFFFSPHRAATAGAIAAAFGAAILPYTLVGPFAGVLLDRWRRRQVLLVVNLLRAGLVAGAAALVLTGTVGAALYGVVLVCLSLNRFFLSGLGAGLPHVVPDDELVMANAVATTLGALAALTGGGAVLGLRSLAGASDGTDALLLTGAAACYLASALLVTRMAAGLLGPDHPVRPPWSDVWTTARSMAGEIADAVAHLRERRRAFAALAVLSGQRFAFGLVTVATFLLCRQTFADPGDPQAGAVALAGAFAASGAGFFAAAVVTPAVTRRIPPTTWILTCCLIATGVAAVFAVRTSYATVLACGALVGFALHGTKLCVDAIVQGDVEDEVRGRVMSFYDMAFNATFVAAAAVCALVLPPSGMSTPLFVAVAVVFALVSAGYAASDRTVSRPAPATT